MTSRRRCLGNGLFIGRLRSVASSDGRAALQVMGRAAAAVGCRGFSVQRIDVGGYCQRFILQLIYTHAHQSDNIKLNIYERVSDG